MNRAIPFLIGKRLWKFKFVHLVIAAFVATVLMAIMLYQGYLVALTGQFGGKLNHPQIPTVYLARAPQGTGLPYVTSGSLQLQLSTWPVFAPGGRVEMAGVSVSRLPEWPVPEPGEVWLPASLRGSVFNEQVDDEITLTRFDGRNWTSATAKVAGYYQDGGYLTPLLANMHWVSEWVRQIPNNTLLAYTERAGQQLERWANNFRQAELLTKHHIAQGAGSLVRSLYAGGNTAVLMGAIFLALGFGVMALLVFLDSRSELAMLKAMGIKPREAGIFFWIEFGISAGVGVLLGWLLMRWLQPRLGTTVVFNGSVFQTALLIIVGSYLLAMLIPTRLAHRAQVNDLLFRRPVLLWSEPVRETRGKQAGLSDLTSKGWTCIKLEVDDGSFPGIILRTAGSSVKEGETLAWQSTWFGLGEKRYIAPHDGILQVADHQRGVLAISHK
ncbi:MAG: FtsX-like permease family protein [Bacillota bacterium]|jgi:hypothetical protein